MTPPRPRDPNTYAHLDRWDWTNPDGTFIVAGPKPRLQAVPDWNDPTFTTWWTNQTGHDDPLDLAELVALTCALILAGIITITGWRKWTR